MPETDEEEETFTQQIKRERQESVELTKRQLDLQERDVATRERQVELMAQHATAPVFQDGPTERMVAFHSLPQDQQDFRLREEGIAIASRVGGTIEEVTANADRIVAYIRG